MKCYYEELGIARDATDADIKSSYRKLALRWHPDKNPDCLEEAKERFQLIQQAYEVLSDPHERCWYDNHREQILRGKNSDYEENCLDVFQYFTVSCFKGYGDDEKGFYSVYREVFEKIAAEDAEFLEDEEAISQIPKFGDSQSSYEEVVGPFYAYWQAYCTKKTYTWLCPYDIHEIKDRRILREIEKEMKKIVQKARKERNEEVRNLVSFVRKRDKRVQAYRRLLEERAAQNRQKQEQNRIKQIRRRQRELEEMQASKQHHDNTEYEEQLKQLEQEYGGDSSLEETEEDELSAESSDEEYLVDNLYCVACNKAFKNEKAYANHESSKKHRDTVERMKQVMWDEEQANQQAREEDETNCASSEESHAIDKNTIEDGIEVAHSSTDNENVQNVSKKAQKRNKKKSKNTKLKTETQETLEEAHADEFIKQATTVDSDVEDWNSTSKKSVRKNKKQTKKSAEPKTTPKETDTTNDVKAAKTDSKSTITLNAPSMIAETSHVCVTCMANFPSKNKLFAHLKLTNHGVYIPKPKGAAPDNAKPRNMKGQRK